jgi:cell division protein FtsQ
MRERQTTERASWDGRDAGRLRRAANRKLKQRRALRLRLPDLRALGALAWTGARRSAPWLGLVAAMSVAGLGLWQTWRWLSSSSRFAVAEVHVEGNSRVTRGELLAHLGDPVGANLFALSTDGLAARLEAVPWVEEARVSRALPDGLRVAVRERRPAALVVADGEYLVDQEGRPFKRAAIERGEADGLIVVTGLPRELWREDPEGAAAAIREGLRVAAAWQQEPTRPAVGEVHLSKSGITLYTLAGAAAIRLGRPRETLDERLARFDAIWGALSEEERAQAKTIWLDSATRKDRVTVRLADARP